MGGIKNSSPILASQFNVLNSFIQVEILFFIPFIFAFIHIENAIQSKLLRSVCKNINAFAYFLWNFMVV